MTLMGDGDGRGTSLPRMSCKVDAMVMVCDTARVLTSSDSGSCKFSSAVSVSQWEALRAAMQLLSWL